MLAGGKAGGSRCAGVGRQAGRPVVVGQVGREDGRADGPFR